MDSKSLESSVRAYMDSKSSVSAQTDLESIIALKWIRIFSLDFMAYVDYIAYTKKSKKAFLLMM